MTGDSSARVIVCQIGAREHYALARTLHRANLLVELITDMWVPPKSVFRHLPGSLGARLKARYDPELAEANVTHFTSRVLARESRKVLSPRQPRWKRIIQDNHWFQAEVVRHLNRKGAFARSQQRPIVFAYSYAARGILAMGREAGATTVLGQIDGGETDEALIASLQERRLGKTASRVPQAYWEDWREECRLADRIVVNSAWSRDLLVRAGVDERKLILLPVVYEYNRRRVGEQRTHALAFNESRPLNVLFLGNLTMRKGVIEALEAARIVANLPVHFTFVGTDSEGYGALLRREPNVTLRGSVARSEVAQQYRDADVFLFPTHSDGFGMTQIEALEAGLPVIASRYCAEVVEHGKTGLVLNEVSGEAIAQAVSHFIHHPEQLPIMSAAAAAASERFAHASVKMCIDTFKTLTGAEVMIDQRRD